MVAGSALLLALAAPHTAWAAIRADFSRVAPRLSTEELLAPSIPAGAPVAAPLSAGRLDALAQQLSREHPEIPSAAVAKAMRYLKAHDISNRRYLAIIDFDRPSSERRLFLIRLSDGSVESYLVAHGDGSGELYATRFSDDRRSHQSSLGLYLTGDDYEGKHGRSLTLRGMEASNDQAESRAVVLHAAHYVSDDYLRRHGELGESWGCPAVDYRYRDRIINALEGGAVLLIHSSGERRSIAKRA